MSKEDVFVLGIESSCDETAASVVRNGHTVLSNVIYSQIDDHTKFGGVVPEVASRRHIETISQIVDQSLVDSGVLLEDVDGIAVTYGPGLIGALLVGLSYAKALAFAASKPLIGVNHIEGHISSNFISNPEFTPPFICLVVSGGHTHLVYVADYGEYDVLGRTRDDAVGEAYDKVARALGLGYPGGPKIDRLAKEGNPVAIAFPRVYLEEGSFDFSFSGIKSAVLNYLNKSAMTGQAVHKADVAASFQKAVIDVLVDKALLACRTKQIAKLALAGGVACNSALRAALDTRCKDEEVDLNIPAPVFCTDNAAMIASCGYFNFMKQSLGDDLDLNAYANLRLGATK